MPSRLAMALVLAVASGCAGSPERAPGPSSTAPGGPVSVAVFEAHLAPFGEWVFVAPHGRAWRPVGVVPGWRPYFHGEWIWTNEGWFWMSDEPWGWATYHYGRWVLDPTFGWLWVPGVEWGPAWVAWLVADGHVGWAPMLPGVDVWWTGAYLVDAAYWVFVPSPRFVGARVNVVALPPAQVRPLVARARPAPPPGHGVARAPPRGGPPRPEIERHVGRPVAQARVVSVPTPDEARARPAPHTVPTYRPTPARAPRPAPAPSREEPKEKK